MSFFSSILQKLGLKKKDETPAAATTAAAPVKPVASVSTSAAPKPVNATHSQEKERDDLDSLRTAVPAAPKPAAISEEDVVKKLEQMAEGSDLNWKTSIVDFLKVLGMDASKDARIELAKELGCPAELIGGDYSKMNVWLHKEVLRQIAQNGGNIPKELLD